MTVKRATCTGCGGTGQMQGLRARSMCGICNGTGAMFIVDSPEFPPMNDVPAHIDIPADPVLLCKVVEVLLEHATERTRQRVVSLLEQRA